MCAVELESRPPPQRADNGFEVGRFVVDRMDEPAGLVLHTDIDDQLLSESLDSSARLRLADLAEAGP